MDKFLESFENQLKNKINEDNNKTDIVNILNTDLLIPLSILFNIDITHKDYKAVCEIIVNKVSTLLIN